MIGFADATAVTSSVNIAKGIMIGGGFIGPCIGMGIIGGGYIQATGRNPEAKLLGQALVFVALVELYALLAFASTFFMLTAK